jgi:hypothetical protein
MKFKKKRNFTSDVKNESIVFLNEHCVHTYVKRNENESIPERQERGLNNRHLFFKQLSKLQLGSLIICKEKFQ